jgi:hypothetical protein
MPPLPPLLKPFAVDAFAMAISRLPGHASPISTTEQSTP